LDSGHVPKSEELDSGHVPKSKDLDSGHVPKSKDLDSSYVPKDTYYTSKFMLQNLPPCITDEVEHFLAFRFNGKKPMVGYRVNEVFYVLLDYQVF
jgi:hypothetical protein